MNSPTRQALIACGLFGIIGLLSLHLPVFASFCIGIAAGIATTSLAYVIEKAQS